MLFFFSFYNFKTMNKRFFFLRRNLKCYLSPYNGFIFPFKTFSFTLFSWKYLSNFLNQTLHIQYVSYTCWRYSTFKYLNDYSASHLSSSSSGIDGSVITNCITLLIFLPSFPLTNRFVLRFLISFIIDLDFMIFQCISRWVFECV